MMQRGLIRSKEGSKKEDKMGKPPEDVRTRSYVHSLIVEALVRNIWDINMQD